MSAWSLCSDSHLWVDRAGLDGADTYSILDGDSHVALLTPGGTPGVLHDPVLTISIGAVSNDEGGVVGVGSASGGAENSAGVLLEDSSVCLD